MSMIPPVPDYGRLLDEVEQANLRLDWFLNKIRTPGPHNPSLQDSQELEQLIGNINSCTESMAVMSEPESEVARGIVEQLRMFLGKLIDNKAIVAFSMSRCREFLKQLILLLVSYCEEIIKRSTNLSDHYKQTRQALVAMALDPSLRQTLVDTLSQNPLYADVVRQVSPLLLHLPAVANTLRHHLPQRPVNQVQLPQTPQPPPPGFLPRQPVPVNPPPTVLAANNLPPVRVPGPSHANANLLKSMPKYSPLPPNGDQPTHPISMPQGPSAHGSIGAPRQPKPTPDPSDKPKAIRDLSLEEGIERAKRINPDLQIENVPGPIKSECIWAIQAARRKAKRQASEKGQGSDQSPDQSVIIIKTPKDDQSSPILVEKKLSASSNDAVSVTRPARRSLPTPLSVPTNPLKMKVFNGNGGYVDAREDKRSPILRDRSFGSSLDNMEKRESESHETLENDNKENVWRPIPVSEFDHTLEDVNARRDMRKRKAADISSNSTNAGTDNQATVEAKLTNIEEQQADLASKIDKMTASFTSNMSERMGRLEVKLDRAINEGKERKAADRKQIDRIHEMLEAMKRRLDAIPIPEENVLEHQEHELDKYFV